MLRDHESQPFHTMRPRWPLLLLGIGFVAGSLITGLFSALPSLQAQSASPLTIQPDTGRVGIGTTSPTNPLHVVGDGGLRLVNTSNPGEGRVYFTAGNLTNSPYIMGNSGVGYQFVVTNSGVQVPATVITNTGNVGIGTTSPGNKLHVNNNVRIAPHTNGETLPYQNVSSILSILSGAHGNPSYVSRIQFGNQYVPAGTAFDAIYTYIDWTSGWLYIKNNQQTKIQIGGGDEWGNQNVYINPTGGNVGIGTTAPAQKLDVAGNVNVSGAYAQGGVAGISYPPSPDTPPYIVLYNNVPCESVGISLTFRGGILAGQSTSSGPRCPDGDVAETYPSREELKPGDVVAVDLLQDESLIKTTQPYQPTAVGIISTHPYLFPGSDKYKHPLALVGRVPVKATTENGPIQRGDYLTSAAKPGYAMKATRPGRVIGIALQPLAEGEGQVIVFVNPTWFMPDARVEAAR